MAFCYNLELIANDTNCGHQLNMSALLITVLNYGFELF